MTTVQLAMRLTENLTVRDWSKLPLNEAEKLREAIQTGLNEFVSLLPAHRVEQPLTQPLRGPITQEIDIIGGANTFAYVAGGSAYPAGGYGRESDAVGCMVTVGSSPLANRLVNPGEILIPYMGASGTQRMTIHGDAVQMGPEVWQIVSDPRWVSSSGAPVTLKPAAPEWARPFKIEYGAPTVWWAESLAGSTHATQPMWVLRVWPVPTDVSYLHLQLSKFPQAVSFLDLHDEPRSLPITATEEPWLISLCEAALTKHPLWRGDVEKSDIRNSAEAARISLRTRNRRMTNTPNRVGTPKGW